MMEPDCKVSNVEIQLSDTVPPPKPQRWMATGLHGCRPNACPLASQATELA